MTTQTQTSRTLSRLENFLILTIGATAGGLIAFLLLGLGLNSLELMRQLSPVWHWVPPAARQAIAQEAALMWPATAKTSAYWYMSRGAGLVSYMLLWATAAWGLLVSTKLVKGLVAAPFVAGLHEFLSLTTLSFAAFHGLALLGDRYINFNLINIVYPFAATYRPGWVGLGQLGFYLTAALVVSFYVRKSIGPRAWRVAHYLTFPAYGLVLVHGITSGTDASALPVQAMYLATGTAIVFLVYYRLLTLGNR
jgi:predicted ferric reductase